MALINMDQILSAIFSTKLPVEGIANPVKLGLTENV
jgi:hypothetical protein